MTREPEGGGRESRVVGIKSSPNIGVPDRRGRELINCRSGGQGGAWWAGGGRWRKGNRKTAGEAGNRR